MTSPSSEPQEALDRSVVSSWVNRLSKAFRRRSIRRTIYVLRTGMGCAFLGLITLFGIGFLLSLKQDTANSSASISDTGIARHFTDSGEAEAWLIVLFGIASLTWAMQPECLYPILEAKTLELHDLNALVCALNLPDAEVHALVAELLCPLLYHVPVGGSAFRR